MLTITYWQSGHERRRREAAERKPDDYVNPYEDATLDPHGGMLRKQLDWPEITFDMPNGASSGIYPTRCSVEDLKAHVQLAICEVLFFTGRIRQDDQGRYVRDDGTPILPWQQPDAT